MTLPRLRLRNAAPPGPLMARRRAGATSPPPPRARVAHARRAGFAAKEKAARSWSPSCAAVFLFAAGALCLIPEPIRGAKARDRIYSTKTGPSAQTGPCQPKSPPKPNRFCSI
ncbi:hypothetical protein scyTo_0004948 [Scyliorhinus torazame]|uniref:Uncharacterized protein n=1 Tax=Scyliorhinus torazame TaxID=75743 RepID=A0A401NZP8_SCYTO|nr:hypothetical protein [Scyliorhinus torazame]